MRRDHPIVWAIVIGHKTTLAIANNLGMPYGIVLRELNSYRTHHLWLEIEDLGSGPLWRLRDEKLLEMQGWVRNRRRNNRIRASHGEADD